MKVYQVGGAVRDRLLGLKVVDRDWVVIGATVEQMLERGFQPVGKDFPVFLHPQTHEEYALARTERKTGRGYGGFQFHAAPDVTLEQDLQRRDLTINAMAQGDDGELIDPYGGRHDLDQRRLRHVSSAFAEDPLRVLRVARFLARFHHLGFSIDTDTLALMRQLSESDELLALSAERVWKETERALGEANPEQYFQTLQSCSALLSLMPELNDGLNLKPLQQAVRQGATLPVRWAVLCAQLKSATVLQQLHERLKAPKAFQQTATLLLHHHPTMQQPLSAPRVMQLYHGLDLSRRPERLDSFIAGCLALYPDDRALALRTEQLQQAISALRQVSPRELVDEGFKGAALGKALQQRQLTAAATSLADRREDQ